MTVKLLDVENLTMKFGGLVAIDDLSFSAAKDQITSIIGPNGAGKTTVFNCLTGFYKATAGSMFLNKENERLNLKKFSDFKVAQKAGVARTFQNIRLFPQMSVLENLMVAQHNKLMKASGFTILGLFNASSFVNKEKVRRGCCEQCNRKVTKETVEAFIFDHGNNWNMKNFTISNYINRNRCSLKRAKPLLVREMLLCQLLCANCDWESTRRHLWNHKAHNPHQQELQDRFLINGL